ncbi:DUF7528 family protein [Halomontanus rarus]|uniref:DUF7528 family protein n=1 Tax=Halomontanus rarus TaxID=3034020 RepID=UPI003CE489F4
MTVDSETHELTLEQARQLRHGLGAALTRDDEFARTVGRYREDGRYVVERRGTNSAGHRKVFETFDACRACFDDLPETFSASDFEYPGVTGSRRHMLVWHFCEHPAFPCTLVSRQPLTGRKVTVTGETESTSSTNDA